MGFLHSKIKFHFLAGIIFLIVSCGQDKGEILSEKQEKDSYEQDSIFSKGEMGSPDFFVGTVWVTPLLAKGKNNDYSIGNVVFEPGARSNWHTHPKGQVLIVTAGLGLHQIKGQKAEIIKKGDVISIPEDKEHWHGASSGSGLTHIALTHYLGEQQVNWLEPVSEGDYVQANQH